MHIFNRKAYVYILVPHQCYSENLKTMILFRSNHTKFKFAALQTSITEDKHWELTIANIKCAKRYLKFIYLKVMFHEI